MVTKLTGKAGKLYRQYIKEGISTAYARRKARGIAAGKSISEARGHKEERLRVRKRGKVGVSVPKSRLEKKPHEWGVYSYFTGISREQENGSEILGMTSYDITKTKTKNWIGGEGQEALFAMHQYMEREFAKYFSLVDGTDFDNATIDSVNHEEQNDRLKAQKHRAYKWQLTDFESGDIRYQIQYEKGQIIMRDMWEDFDFLQFKLEIRELKIWE